ncbi:unnamed protein product [Heterobilharzia americana]|nr:unnamed protein product [Heterobilharzia americana]
MLRVFPLHFRPVIGYVNLCSSKMDITYPGVKNTLGVLIHEIGHALGFSAYNFPFMRYPSGKPRTPRGKDKMPLKKDKYGYYLPSTNTVKMITRSWRSVAGTFTKTFGSMVTPAVLRAARAHFGCKTLNGADLENQYQSPLGSHWEGRIFHGEILAGRIQINYAVSNVTLAFFKDSGWYKVNYRKAMEWPYGKNLGCNFATKSCYEFAEIQRGKNQTIAPFCDNSKITCMGPYAYGMCNILIYDQPLPVEDRFFATDPYGSGQEGKYFGGEDPFQDYCPTQVFVTSLGPEYPVNSFCTHTENIEKSKKGTNYFFQTYGTKAICIENRPDWVYEDSYQHSLPDDLLGTCHRYECTRDKRLVVLFKDSRVTCPKNGGEHRFNVTDGTARLSGTIICPKSTKFCK